MLKAATYSQIIEVLRKHRPIYQITPEIRVAAAQKKATKGTTNAAAT